MWINPISRRYGALAAHIWGGLILGLAFLCGCHSNPQTAASPPPPDRGERQVYRVNYETAFAAAVGAAQMDGLDLIDYDKNSGHIWAKRALDADNFGERINIWVRTVATNETSVQVISRRNMPPGVLSQYWEHVVLLNVRSMVED